MRTNRGWLLTVGGLIAIGGGLVLFRNVTGDAWITRPSLAVLRPISQEEELARWGNAADSIKRNRYAPETVRASISPQEMRPRIARFVAFAKARKAVLNGTADRATTIAYYT